MSGKRLKYSLFKTTERDYWKNVHVNIDTICDNWEEVYKDECERLLNKFSEPFLSDVIRYYKISKGSYESKEACILKDKKSAIDLLCVVKFSLHNPKSIAQISKIPIRNGKVNKQEVIKTAFNFHKKKEILNLFLTQLKIKKGKGFYNFNFDVSASNLLFDKFTEVIEYLTRYLKKNDKKKKAYYFRNSVKNSDEWLFLLLKETSDVIYPAIPDNTRVLKGTYLLISVIPHKQQLEINTTSKYEAYKIKDYLARKIDKNLRYIRKSSSYSPVTFLQKIKEQRSENAQLVLTDIEFRKSEINSLIKVSDPDHKNDIFTQLTILKEKGIVKIEDFSEFKSLTFLFKGLYFRINVEETKWGQIKFNLTDKNKPANETKLFKNEFESNFSVPLDVYLSNANTSIDLKNIARHLLDKNVIESNIPREVEDVLLDLINLKILNKPIDSVKRRCENPKCRKITWAKGDCPSCGNGLNIEGNYVDLKINITNANNYVFEQLQKTGAYSLKKVKKQIDGTTFNMIDLLNNNGEPLTIFISGSIVPEKIVRHFRETGLPLLVILCRYKDALIKDVKSNGFECTDISELFSLSNSSVSVNNLLNSFIELQNQKWKGKLIEKGFTSYQRLVKKPNDYGDQDFEKDIFNILHEIFIVGDRLGGKFAGIPAPDGIVSIQDYTNVRKRYCMAWDCKYSVTKNGYQLNDKPEKHRKYINSLSKNNKVSLYGGLRTYAVISQNMNEAAYIRFYEKLIKRFKWKGNVIFLTEDLLLKIYKLYKDNEAIIQRSPKLFYEAIFNLFKDVWKTDSIPYKKISAVRMNKAVLKIQGLFAKNKLNFTFERNEF